MAARMVRSLWMMLSEGAVDFVRTPGIAVASIGTAAVTLLLIAAYIVAAANVARLSTSVSSQVDMRAFLSSGITRRAETALMRDIEAIPGVRRVTFISKAEALAQLRREFAGNGPVEAVLAEGNPLLDAFDVRTTTPSAAAAVARRVGALPGVTHLVYPGQTVARIDDLLAVVRWAGLVLAALLAASSFLVTSNTIRLAVLGRRREIEIMLLVGASRSMVRGPFVVEGMILGAAGGAVAAAVSALGYGMVARVLERIMPFLPVVPAGELNLRITAYLLAGGLGLGYIGAVFALRRLVRVASEA